MKNAILLFAWSICAIQLNAQTLISGEVKQGTSVVSGAQVSLVLPWTNNAHPWVSLTATTNAQGQYSFLNSDLSGYSEILSLKLNAGQNNNTEYFPNDIANTPLPTSPTIYNFNSQPVTPTIAISAPSPFNQTITYGASVNLEAMVDLSYDDETTTLSSVSFKVDNVVVSSNANGNIYSGSWSPQDSDFGDEHEFKVTAVASNGETVNETFNFELNCTGNNCPNILPKIVANTPSNTTINQNEGLVPVPIQVTVTDSDGTIASVTISIDGVTTNMISGANNTYSYNFTPTNHQSYPLTITATDNEGGIKVVNETLNIIDSQFVPLPSGNIILGYTHTWENGSAPFLYFSDMLNKNYNVVMYSFIETVGQNGYTPSLTINTPRYIQNGSFNSQLLKDDIQSLRDEGIPVIASIGGQNGHVELNTVAQKDEFVQGLINIIDTYGFDGLDLDFEGSSMNFGAGALTDFSYANLSPYPKLKNVVDAFKEIKQHYGSSFIMTCAPETFYVQVGYSTYNDRGGSFLPVIHNLRDELDLIMVQLYNTGSVNALNGIAYSQATPDFLVSMSDMLISGFNVASTGFHFTGLPASKIMFGLPSCPDAAPAGGYIQPTQTIKALNYMRFGTDFAGRNYTLRGNAHPNLRGVMTWSVNWDAAQGCASAYEFSNSYSEYFDSTLSTTDIDLENENVRVYPVPAGSTLNIESKKPINNIQLFNINGARVYEQQRFEKSLDIGFLQSGIYVLQIEIDKQLVYKKIINANQELNIRVINAAANLP